MQRVGDGFKGRLEELITYDGNADENVQSHQHVQYGMPRAPDEALRLLARWET